MREILQDCRRAVGALKIPVSPTALAVGLVVVACAVGGSAVYAARGAYELDGKVLKVRTKAMDEASSVVVVDFRFTNPSNYNFVVREVGVSIEDRMARSSMAPRSPSSTRGGCSNIIRSSDRSTTLAAHEKQACSSSDFRSMIAARFEAPESALESRKNLDCPGSSTWTEPTSEAPREEMKLSLVLLAAGVVAAQTADHPITTCPYTPSLDIPSMDQSVSRVRQFLPVRVRRLDQEESDSADQARWNVYSKLHQDNLMFLWGFWKEAAKPSESRSAEQRQIAIISRPAWTSRRWRRPA